MLIKHSRISFKFNIHFIYISYTFHIHFIYISYTFRIHFIYISYTFRIHFIYISYTFHIHFVYISYTFRIHFVYISYTFRIHFVYISYTFRIHFVYISYTFRIHFVYISYTFHIHFVYISYTFRIHFVYISYTFRIHFIFHLRIRLSYPHLCIHFIYIYILVSSLILLFNLFTFLSILDISSCVVRLFPRSCCVFTGLASTEKSLRAKLGHYTNTGKRNTYHYHWIPYINLVHTFLRIIFSSQQILSEILSSTFIMIY